MGISVHTPRISDNEIYSEQKESSHSETNVDSLASIEPQAPDISHDGLFKSVPQICNEHRVRGDSTVRSLSSTWPMFKNTPERIGDSNSNIPESTPVKTLWESQAESSYSSPVV